MGALLGCHGNPGSVSLSLSSSVDQTLHGEVL